MLDKRGKAEKQLDTISRIILTIFLLLISVVIATAHDPGVSAINMYFAEGRLMVYSSYAKHDLADIGLAPGSYEFESLIKNAVSIEIDGNQLAALSSEMMLDGADGVTIESDFGNFGIADNSKIRVISRILKRLNPQHRQILRIYRDDTEIVNTVIKENANSHDFEATLISIPPFDNGGGLSLFDGFGIWFLAVGVGLGLFRIFYRGWSQPLM